MGVPEYVKESDEDSDERRLNDEEIYEYLSDLTKLN
jgi:hypothetical protein